MADTNDPTQTDSTTQSAQDSEKPAPTVTATVPKLSDKPVSKAVVMKLGFKDRFKERLAGWWSNPKSRYGTIVGVLFILLVLFAIPLTRYNILGLALKSQATVLVLDSKTNAHVSGATVSIGGKQAQTDAAGKAIVYPHLGSKQVTVSKKYYKGTSQKELVGIAASHNNFKIKVLALGRQVQVKLVDKISGQPLGGAEISAQGAKAKTDVSGLATLVVASASDTVKLSIARSGYITTSATATAAGDLAKNTFGVIASGKLYFLSNLSGDVDVVKTNLDGSSRQTVLKGTGSEDPANTSLLASRDWKYLALLSKRSGSTASVYIIDTTNNDKLIPIDQANANYTFVGWSGDNFIYQTSRNDLGSWQSNQQSLKSYNTDSGQTLLLDQTQASGTSSNDFIGQSFGAPYIVGSQVLYSKAWNASASQATQIASKQAELDTIGSDGSSHKVLKSFSSTSATQSQYIGISTQPYEPGGIYIDFNDNGQDNFYEYDNGTISPDTSLTSTTFYQTPYPTYLLSPSGSATFWAEQRDGKNTLFVGNQDGKSGKQIASLSPYQPYGWYTDNYLLVTKGSSELYIMPKAGGTPIKVSDYYKPPINYNGYGGGYGGL